MITYTYGKPKKMIKIVSTNQHLWVKDHFLQGGMGIHIITWQITKKNQSFAAVKISCLNDIYKI